jgi:hypothetical protein
MRLGCGNPCNVPARKERTMSFQFWQKWLVGSSLGLVVFGLGLALFNQSWFFNLVYHQHIHPVFWENGILPGKTPLFETFVYGVLGAVVMGWGIMLAFIAHNPFRKREPWSWWAVLTGMTAWFLLDTAISLYFQVTANAAGNVALFVFFIIPLLATRKSFFPGCKPLQGLA